MHPHAPPVTRGADGGGVPGNTCGACHLDRNVEILAGQQTSFQSIPGHPRWGLAPIEMAWEGKSMGEICRQIKDPQRNGGRSLALLHEHLAKDDLVGWAWMPGRGARSGTGHPGAAGRTDPGLDRQRRRVPLSGRVGKGADTQELSPDIQCGAVPTRDIATASLRVGKAHTQVFGAVYRRGAPCPPYAVAATFRDRAPGPGFPSRVGAPSSSSSSGSTRPRSGTGTT